MIPKYPCYSFLPGVQTCFPFLQERKLTLEVMVEVYSDNMILFMGPQDHQDEFFVPEAKAAETE